MTPRETRAELGLSQAEMARLMGVHVMTLSKWERGVRQPDKAAVRLMEVLLWLNKNYPKPYSTLSGVISAGAQFSL